MSCPVTTLERTACEVSDLPTLVDKGMSKLKIDETVPSAVPL